MAGAKYWKTRIRQEGLSGCLILRVFIFLPGSVLLKRFCVLCQKSFWARQHSSELFLETAGRAFLLPWVCPERGTRGTSGSSTCPMVILEAGAAHPRLKATVLPTLTKQNQLICFGNPSSAGLLEP